MAAGVYSMKPGVVIPTYNEQENIIPLVQKILRIVPDCRILVVDDSSPDGTAALVNELARTEDRVSCILQQRRGRGPAEVEGIRFFMNQPDVGAVLFMDADFSHDPVFIPDLLQALETSDLVLGSRFVAKGRDLRRNLVRRILSRMAAFYIRKVCGITAHDPASGYRCLRKEVFERLDPGRARSVGPPFLVELLFLCQSLRLRVGEVPIVFQDRREGDSKLNLAILLASLALPWRLKWRAEDEGWLMADT